MQATIKRRFIHNGYKVVVVCKPEGGQLVPLKFDVYYNKVKINWRLTWRQIRLFNEAIYEELNYSPKWREH